MLTIIGGPMFSGKTTRLLEFVNGLQDNSYRVYKPSIDTRYAFDACVTHAGVRHAAINLDPLNPRFSNLNANIKTIFVDELNFFDSKNMLYAVKDQLTQGRDVIGAGLFYNHLRLPFGPTIDLAKIADNTIKLYSACDGCGRNAEHVYRKFKSNKIVVLGTSGKYGACCNDCWEKLSQRDL